MYKTQQFETGIQESQIQNDKCSPTVNVINGYLVTKMSNRTEIMETF